MQLIPLPESEQCEFRVQTLNYDTTTLVMCRTPKGWPEEVTAQAVWHHEDKFQYKPLPNAFIDQLKTQAYMTLLHRLHAINDERESDE